VNKEDDTKLRSWILLLAGLFGIGYQQYTGETNWVLLLIFTSMTGVPGVTSIISLIKSSPIILQSSSSREESSEQESEKSS
jgi:hypothetical protein